MLYFQSHTAIIPARFAINPTAVELPTPTPTTTPSQTNPFPGTSAQNAAQEYNARCARFAAKRDEIGVRWNGVANLRLGAFLAALACFILALWQGWSVLYWVGLLVLVAFFVLVGYHSRLGRKRRRFDGLYTLNNEARLRLRREWSQLPLRHTIKPDPLSPYAGDLDIFGRASLFQLIETVSTSMGEAKLGRWLMRFAPVAVIQSRQAAVAELAPMIDLRDDLALPGRLLGDTRPDPEPFLQWAESAPWLAKMPWLRWVALVDIILLWALLLAQLFGLTAYPFYLVFAAANLLFSLSSGKAVYSILERASTREGAFRQYAEMFALLSHANFSSPMLRDLQARLTANGVPAHSLVKRLYRITRFTIPPSSQLYLVIQALTLWDVHVLAALERWQALAGRHTRDWLAVLGEVEALSALSVPAHDNPDWAFPDVDVQADKFEAVQLGHPLISAGVRVCNDVEVGPPGSFLLVTGSNMSGKSTLLRAIGVNIVLAGAGGPVCARSLRLPPVELWSSMRVQDSLEQGVSYFMAELRRLKQVVDAARRPANSSTRLFYLLDEILHGTNTAERQIAARRVVFYLVHQGALGAVSTHDLTFAQSPEIASAARLYHFSETFTEGLDGPQMDFSYELQPGISTSTNALNLMKIVGLDLED